MSEFDFEDITLNEGMISLDNDAMINANHSYLQEQLSAVDSGFLSDLAKKITYGESFHEQGWKIKGFAEVGWRKSF